MSLRKYGIYLAWTPFVELRAEGLGRYLVKFIAAAQTVKNSRIIIVLPSWSRIQMEKLLHDEGVEISNLEFISPGNIPLLLKIYNRKKIQTPVKQGLVEKSKNYVRAVLKKTISFLGNKLASLTDFKSIVLFLFYLLLTTVLGAVVGLLLTVITLIFYIFYNFFKVNRLIVKRLYIFCSELISTLGLNRNYQSWLLEKLVNAEEKKLVELANQRDDVIGWYCPTAFWESFNKIQTKVKLLCVPDVVLFDFPYSFQNVLKGNSTKSLDNITKVIKGAKYYVTYSQVVKWKTLVDRYNISDKNISVVHHAPSTLEEFALIDGTDGLLSHEFAVSNFQNAFFRFTIGKYTSNFSGCFSFIFYATQARPNKNLLMLLKAYNFLLKNKLIKYKLILTCNRLALKEVDEFIEDNNLNMDVIFCHGLSTKELAAMYKLALLAVNPSLSEGGCPFTFTEAMSVGTPTVMADIEVTREVISDQYFVNNCLFDPYDYIDMADKINWGVENRDFLYKMQLPLFKNLMQRTWIDVATEHLTILDNIHEDNVEGNRKNELNFEK